MRLRGRPKLSSFSRAYTAYAGGEGVKGDRTLFLNVVYSNGNEIIAHVRRTSMTKNPLVRNSLLVLKLRGAK